MYTVQLTEGFRAWLKSLRDRRANTAIVLRLQLVVAGSLGDWRPVGGNVSEMRIRVGAGYRIYFIRRGRGIIVVLAGGDKSSQRKDIERAMQIATQLERES